LHTVATDWAGLLDVVPILIFQLVFLWLYLRGMAGVSGPASALFLALFIGGGVFVR
jgi:hypothetical protein